MSTVINRLKPRCLLSVLLLVAASLACNLAPGGGEGGQEPLPGTSTPTPTLLPVGGGAGTPEPGRQGLALEFTLEGAAGWATMTGQLHTCSGAQGPWVGTFNLSYDDGMNWRCTGSVDVEISLPPGSSSANGTVTVPLECQAVEPECVVDEASEVSTYLFELAPGGDQVTLTIGSTGGGEVTETCTFYGETDTVHIPAMAFFFGENKVTVPLQDYNGCP